MKTLIFIIIAAIMLTSCSFESYQCHSYGNTNHSTKHGNKAQNKYYKKKHLI